jgi:hypothetical protein
VIEIEFEQNGELVILHLTKGVLVMPRPVFVEALKRGKKYRRRSGLEKRLAAQLGDNGFHQMPTEVPRRTTELSSTELVENPIKIVSADEPTSQDRHARLAHVRHGESNELKVLKTAKESSMAVWLEIELPASEIGETGYLRDIDYLQLPASHVKVVALEADGTWFGVREWSALEAPPPYQRARVQVSLEPGPTPLTAKNVVTLAKGAQAMLDSFGAAARR